MRPLKTPVVPSKPPATGVPEKRVTIRDVAQRAGVATGSVSRVLNNNASVMPEVRERVQAAIRELNFEPSVVARNMRAGSTQTVGCLVSDVVQLTAAQMITGAETQLRNAGYAMFIANSHYVLETEKQILKSFRQRKIDGLILIIHDDEDPAYIAELEAMGLPIVLWERDAGGRFTSVLSDHASGCRQAISYLAGLGHQRVALVAGPSSTWVGREMVRGYRLAHDTHALKQDDALIHHTDAFDLSSCSQLMSSARRPTAIVAPVNDLTLVMSVARSMGLAIPNDLSVISLGDASLLGITRPGITAIRHNPVEVGKTAADLLLKLLNGTDTEIRRVVFPAELIVRESCAAPADGKAPRNARSA